MPNPKFAYELRDSKLANIGFLTHLQSGTATPVRHWIEVLDDVLPKTP